MTTTDIALELAELRRLVDVGFAETNGKLNLLVASDERTNVAVDDLQKRVTALERTKWLAMGAGVVLGGSAGGLVQLLGR